MLVCTGYDAIKTKYKMLDTEHFDVGNKLMQERTVIHKFEKGIDVQGIPFKEKTGHYFSHKYYIDFDFYTEAYFYDYTLNQIQNWTILHIFIKYRLDEEQHIIKGKPINTYIFYKDELIMTTRDVWFPSRYIDYQVLDGRELYLIGSNDINIRLRYNIDGSLVYQAIQSGTVDYENIFNTDCIDKKTGRHLLRYIGNNKLYDLSKYLTDIEGNRVLYSSTEFDKSKQLFMLKYPKIEPLIKEIYQKFRDNLQRYNFLFKNYYLREDNNGIHRGNRNRFIFFNTAFRLDSEDLFIELAQRLGVLDIHADIGFKGDTATLTLLFAMTSDHFTDGYVGYRPLPYLQDKFQITIKR